MPAIFFSLVTVTPRISSPHRTTNTRAIQSLESDLKKDLGSIAAGSRGITRCTNSASCSIGADGHTSAESLLVFCPSPPFALDAASPNVLHGISILTKNRHDV